MLLTLPYPPSNNLYYRHVGHKVLLSERGRDYRRLVGQECLVQLVGVPRPLTGRLAMWIYFHVPDRRKRDADNTVKGVQDALQHAGVYLDDAQIDELHLIRCGVVPGGKLEVRIDELG